MASEGLHESADKLRPETQDYHRAMVSLMEELEAVDWYNQRVDATDDEELKEILAHNRDEEKEHASMVLEWLRRKDAKLAQWLSTYLFQKGSITRREAEETGQEAGNEGKSTSESAASATAPAADGSLGIGSLRGGR